MEMICGWCGEPLRLEGDTCYTCVVMINAKSHCGVPIGEVCSDDHHHVCRKHEPYDIQYAHKCYRSAKQRLGGDSPMEAAHDDAKRGRTEFVAK